MLVPRYGRFECGCNEVLVPRYGRFKCGCDGVLVPRYGRDLSVVVMKC